MTRDQCLVIVAPCLGAAGGDAAGALRFDEFDASRIGKALLGRIDNLHDMAVGACRGQLVTLRRTSLIGTHRSDSSTISESGDGAKVGGRLARSRRVVKDRFRHFFDDVAARGRPR